MTHGPIYTDKRAIEVILRWCDRGGEEPEGQCLYEIEQICRKQLGLQPLVLSEPRTDGHSALRVNDGKLEQFDPHPITEQEVSEIRERSNEEYKKVRLEAERTAQQRSDEAWMHAACLTIAETGQKWGDAVHPSPAMKAVYKLRQDMERFKEFGVIMARACGNWREWPGAATDDHDHPDWKAAARAILEREALVQKLRTFANEHVCPVNENCQPGFVSGAFSAWGWARNHVSKLLSELGKA